MINGWSIFPCPSFFTIAMVFRVLSFGGVFFFLYFVVSCCFRFASSFSIALHCTLCQSRFIIHKMFKAIFLIFERFPSKIGFTNICAHIHNLVFAFLRYSSTGRWPNDIDHQLIFIVWLDFFLCHGRPYVQRKAEGNRKGFFFFQLLGHCLCYLYWKLSEGKTPKKKKPNILMKGFYNVSCMAPSTMFTFHMICCFLVTSQYRPVVLKCSQILFETRFHYIRVVEWNSHDTAKCQDPQKFL